MGNGVIYGNEVIYITCKEADLDSIPVVDGQLIVFYDASGMYYDMGDVRHQVSGTVVVNQLPNKDYARNNTLYIVVPESGNPNIYIWNGKEFVQLIPDQVIQKDAPDDLYRYMRVKDKWVSDQYTFYVNDEDNPEDQLSNLNRFLSITAGENIKVVGKFKLQLSDSALEIDGNQNNVDFSQANFSDYESSEYTLDILAFKNIITVKGLNGTRFSFRKCNHFKDCTFVDTSIYFEEDNEDYSIRNSIFTFRKRGGIGVKACKSLSITECQFISQLDKSLYSAITLSDFNNTITIDDNQFIRCLSITSTFVSNSTHSSWIETCLADSSEECGLLMKQLGYGLSAEGANTSGTLLSVTEHNELHIKEYITSLKSLRWILASTGDFSNSLINIGDVFHLDSSRIYVGIAAIDSEKHSALLEVNPNIFTQYSILTTINSDEDIQKYTQNITRVSKSGQSYSNKIMPMILNERNRIEDISFDTLPVSVSESSVGTLLEIYQKDIEYSSEEISSQFTSASHTYITDAGVDSLASGATLGDVGIEHISVDEDGTCSKITSFTSTNDIRMLLKC